MPQLIGLNSLNTSEKMRFDLKGKPYKLVYDKGNDKGRRIYLVDRKCECGNIFYITKKSRDKER